MPKLIVNYNSEYGIAVADGKTREAILWYYQERPTMVTVGTQCMIYAARVLIKQGLISHDQIEFRFGDIVIKHYPDGRFDHWPSGFCDVEETFLLELI